MDSISRNDVVRLLALAAGGDQRTVAPEDIVLWHGIAVSQRWTFNAAQRAVFEHYASGASKPRLTPAEVTDRIRSIRSRAAESFEAPRIPDELADGDYPAWYRSQLRAHIDHELGEWAITGQEPSRNLPIADRARSLPELIAGAPEHVRAQLTRDVRKVGTVPAQPQARTKLDVERRAEARAELDNARRAAEESA